MDYPFAIGEINKELYDEIDIQRISINEKLIYSIHIESDLDKYIKLYSYDNDTVNAIEIIKKNIVLNKIDINNIFIRPPGTNIKNIKLNLDIYGIIIINMFIKYDDVIKLYDLVINYYYEYSDEKNLLIIKDQYNMIINNIENISGIEYYNNIIKEITSLTYDKLNIIKEDGNSMVIKYKDYILKIFSIKIDEDNDAFYYEDEFNEYLNEAFVGLFALNKLRNMDIPNFALIYNINFNNICVKSNYFGSENKCSYILYEYIEGPLIDKFINKNTSEDNISIINQVIYSLYEAYIICDFTHYDLHHHNILIRQLDENIDIVYPNSDIIINTNIVAVIIDYGLSHVKVNGIDYGRNLM
jgi:serine/threonine protein kinase